ncbi:MAG: S1 RNA-binding domain-containing protein [Chloroflexi bacterium]|nr:S1 RNA-binding domain-containing protein [Chloroflexota bacterium]
MTPEQITPLNKETEPPTNLNEESVLNEEPVLNTESMAEMLESYLSCQQLERGKIVPGTVVHIGSNAIIVDVGAKCEGVVPERDLERLMPEDRDAIRQGDQVMVYVVETEDANDSIVLSLSRAQIVRDWQEAQRLFETQQVVESQIVDCNKGGVIVNVGKLRGFVPGSQLDASRIVAQQVEARSQSEDSTPPARSGGGERWIHLIGEAIQLKVIEVDRERNRLILSEKAALRDWRKSQREKLLVELNEGDVRPGRIINLADFGAFVDIGGIDGLVHLSELSWERVDHPRKVVQVGQTIQVYVLSVDRERQRVALSIKRLLSDPWDSIEERYQEGQLVEGTITRLTKWGAFASIVGDEAIEGLIHVSELDEGHVVHPREVVQVDQVVTLRVMGVDANRHRMALSLKQVSQGEYLDQDWETMLATDQPELEGSLSAAISETSLLQEPPSEVQSEV